MVIKQSIETIPYDHASLFIMCIPAKSASDVKVQQNQMIALKVLLHSAGKNHLVKKQDNFFTAFRISMFHMVC